VVGGSVEGRRRRRGWAYSLFLLPVAAVAYPPFYSRVDPTLVGVPFFVWYQLVVVVFGGLITGVVYLLLGAERAASA
jgi:hypothetical protein